MSEKKIYMEEAFLSKSLSHKFCSGFSCQSPDIVEQPGRQVQIFQAMCPKHAKTPVLNFAVRFLAFLQEMAIFRSPKNAENGGSA